MKEAVYNSIALDYFEPFINKPDPYYNLDFLEDWSAFVQKLSNIFSFYLPEDEDEDTIVSQTSFGCISINNKSISTI